MTTRQNPSSPSELGVSCTEKLSTSSYVYSDSSQSSRCHSRAFTRPVQESQLSLKPSSLAARWRILDTQLYSVRYLQFRSSRCPSVAHTVRSPVSSKMAWESTWSKVSRKTLASSRMTTRTAAAPVSWIPPPSGPGSMTPALAIINAAWT